MLLAKFVGEFDGVRMLGGGHGARRRRAQRERRQLKRRYGRRREFRTECGHSGKEAERERKIQRHVVLVTADDAKEFQFEFGQIQIGDGGRNLREKNLYSSDRQSFLGYACLFEVDSDETEHVSSVHHRQGVLQEKREANIDVSRQFWILQKKKQ